VRFRGCGRKIVMNGEKNKRAPESVNESGESLPRSCPLRKLIGFLEENKMGLAIKEE
jgi:hypothetical protein